MAVRTEDQERRMRAAGARATAGIRFRRDRRRRLLVLTPVTAVALWSLADLVAARHGRLVAEHADALRHLVDHSPPVVWTIALVLGPLALALKPPPVPAGALLALFSGPVLTPLLFGGGGWHAWQIAALAAATAAMIAGRRPKRRA